MGKRAGHNPTVGKEALIDERAKRTFPSLLPLPWKIREQKPDFAVDYLIELVEGGEHTGIQFGVQLKGRQATKKNQSFARDLKTKHICYWLNDYRLPVFIVLVDFDSKEVRWRFVQEWAKGLPKEKLAKQTQIRVHFPPENLLSDEIRLKVAVDSAVKFMEDLHPGSIKAALDKKKAEIQEKDPRFAVSIDLIDGVQHVKLKPASDLPVAFKVQIKTKDAIEKVKCLLEAGDDLSLEAGEFEVSDLPHFVESGSALRQLMQFSPANVRKAELLVVLPSNLDPVVLKGELRHGSKFLQFKGQSLDHPLSVYLKFSHTPTNGLQVAESSLRLDIDKWSSKPLVLLPFLEDVLNLAEAWSKHGDLDIRLRFDGNTLLTGRQQSTEQIFWKAVERVARALKQCSELCHYFKINVRFPGVEHLSEQVIEEIDAGHSLVFKGEFSMPIPGREFKVIISSVAMDIAESTVGGFRRVAEFSLSLFGHELFKRQIFVESFSQRLISKTQVEAGIEFHFKGEENTVERITFAD